MAEQKKCSSGHEDYYERNEQSDKTSDDSSGSVTVHNDAPPSKVPSA